MATLSETIKDLTNKIGNDCKEMRERLDSFPIKVIKSYRRYNFSPDNKLKFKGKNITIPDLIDYIVSIYKKLGPITKLSYWRNDIKSCSQLYRQSKSEINYSDKTYENFKKRATKEFYIPLREITDLSKEIAKSIKNFTLRESEEINLMARLTRTEYEGVIADIQDQQNIGVITESEAFEMLQIVHKENEEYFKEDMREMKISLDKVHECGLISEDAYTEGIDNLYNAISSVAGIEIAYEGCDDIPEQTQRISEMYQEMKRELYMECYLERITPEERNDSVMKLEQYVSESTSVDEFVSKITG